MGNQRHPGTQSPFSLHQQIWKSLDYAGHKSVGHGMGQRDTPSVLFLAAPGLLGGWGGHSSTVSRLFLV